MVAFVVLATDAAQSLLSTHGFCLGEVGHQRRRLAHDDKRIETLHLCLQGVLDGRAAGNDERLVAGATLRDEHAVLDADLGQLAVADVVAVVAQTVNLQDAADELRSLLVHGVDIELHQQVLAIATVLAGLLGIVVTRSALAPHVPDGQIDEEVVVGLTHLQETLTALDIFHEVGRIAPDAVRWTHIHRGIELPSWPGVILGRVARAMEIDVVDTTGEHQVQVGLHLRPRCAEVFCQPGECLAAGEGLAHDVGCRRGIFQHRYVAEVLLRLAWVCAQSLDAEL